MHSLYFIYKIKHKTSCLDCTFRTQRVMLSHTLFIKRMAKRHTVLDSCTIFNRTAFADADNTTQPPLMSLPLSPQSASTDSFVAKPINSQAYKNNPYTSTCLHAAYAGPLSPKHATLDVHNSCLHPANSKHTQHPSNTSSDPARTSLIARAIVSRVSHHRCFVQPIASTLPSSNRRYTASKHRCSHEALQHQQRVATATPPPTPTLVLHSTPTICHIAHSNDNIAAKLISNFHRSMCIVSINIMDIEDNIQHVSYPSFVHNPTLIPMNRRKSDICLLASYTLCASTLRTTP